MSGAQYTEFLFLDRILSGHFDEKAADKWVPSAEMRENFREALRDSVARYGYDVGNKYDDIVDLHINQMSESGILLVEGDQYTGEYWRFDVRPKDDYVRMRLSDQPVALRIKKLGTPALERALIALSDAEGWGRVNPDEPGERSEDHSLGEESQISDIVPASDRIVTRADNLPIIEAAAEEIEALRDSLRTGNEAGDRIGDDRQIIDLELEIANEVIARPRFRLQSIVGWLLPTLRFLIDKFAGGAIAEAAKRLMSLLLGLL